MPVVRKKVYERDERQNRPLNCLKWSRDGKRLATGDSSGQISIFSVDNELAVAKQDDFDKMLRLMQQGK